MEKIYPPENLNATDHLDIKEYFSKYSSICNLDKDTKNSDVNSRNVSIKFIVENIVGDPIHLSKVNTMSKILSPQLLVCDDQLEKPIALKSTSYTEMPPTCYNVNEEIINKLEVLKAKKQLQNDTNVYMRYNAACSKIYDPEYKQINESEQYPDLVPKDEVVVYVRVYRPFVHRNEKVNTYTNFKCSQEIKMLGSNTVAQLRDKILCCSDAGICKEVQDPFGDEIDGLVGRAKEKYPSGFIFIDGVFYNDFRHPKAIDYSEVIRKWAIDRQIGEFQTGNIYTMIKYLKPRLGYPYVYQHHGDCEHIIIFTDVQLLTKEDCLYSSDYPQYFTMHKNMSEYCHICGATVSRWLCVDSDRLPKDKTFLCEECFKSYNYNRRQKIGNFKAYPYYDSSFIM